MRASLRPRSRSPPALHKLPNSPTGRNAATGGRRKWKGLEGEEEPRLRLDGDSQPQRAGQPSPTENRPTKLPPFILREVYRTKEKGEGPTNASIADRGKRRTE